jgi:AraC-like DNA-binding protein
MVHFPEKHLIVFWALIPHKTMSFESDTEYYTCTIPLATFLSWNLNKKFKNDILQGYQLVVPDRSVSDLDENLLQHWHNDLSACDDNIREVVLEEMKARMKRFALNYNSISQVSHLNTQSAHRPGICSESSDFVAKLSLIIASRFKEPLKIAEIGEELGLHPDYANTLCKKAYGCTLHQYLLQERINYVERMLITTDEPITQIAKNSGFSTVARFNSTFLKFVGCTPSEYRKTMCL